MDAVGSPRDGARGEGAGIRPGGGDAMAGDFSFDEAYRIVRERMAQERAAAQGAPAPADAPAGGEAGIRVVVADDQDLVRSGFKMILSSYAGIQVVGEARTGIEAVEVARRERPNVVLMDIRMPLANGIEATRQIAADPDLSGTRVLVITTFDIDEYVYDALAAGAGGFMLKDAEPDDIAQAVRIVARGDALIQPSVMRRLVETFVASRSGAAVRAMPAGLAFSQLTAREREILAKVAHGLSNDDIAADLVISPATVKTHLARIMAKLNAHDRAQLVIAAYEGGLVAPGARPGGRGCEA